MDETEEKFKKFELDDAKLINEMKIQNAKRKKFTAQVKNRLFILICYQFLSRVHGPLHLNNFRLNKKMRILRG